LPIVFLLLNLVRGLVCFFWLGLGVRGSLWGWWWFLCGLGGVWLGAGGVVLLVFPVVVFDFGGCFAGGLGFPVVFWLGFVLFFGLGGCLFFLGVGGGGFFFFLFFFLGFGGWGVVLGGWGCGGFFGWGFCFVWFCSLFFFFFFFFFGVFFFWGEFAPDVGTLHPDFSLMFCAAGDFL